ncbi:hypothetical protein BJ508DRAFT_372158 [Ascobolus immersus RN42]|uniref:Uncharacterized protein n=1 Tax=Ascobolus immersus RN42 TaxID=1160509 RepID=A0A3N4ILM9_ASCIM|nr:hypothetical protein BJ508DRAFT_372158 [Ascobolus immersus RN42]
MSTTDPLEAERTILRNFLLPPAALPQFCTFKAFTQFFPPQYRTNPDVKLLYRTLQHQRQKTINLVERNIDVEVQVTSKQLLEERDAKANERRKALNKVKGGGIGNVASGGGKIFGNNAATGNAEKEKKDGKKKRKAGEMEDSNMDELIGPGEEKGGQTRLTNVEIMKALKMAVEGLEGEYEDLTGECDTLVEEIRDIMGELSDVRYGRLAAGLAESVEEQLRSVVGIAEEALKEAEEGEHSE